ncbi:uncharacterized protein FJT64_027342 [Amphibalanus amphitrite]|uniref:Peptidase A2 domain-containing protein n=1 Tax=Amphibalanus amphitrite TaxID=1232801 RepID=A0A6A4W424_AMPAM|nr:uncharacterized protein FJT64_027342 [Amphibalanus amphitrite]
MDIQGPTRRCAVLLHLVGPDIADVSDSLPEEEAEGPEEDEFTRLKRKLVRYLVPRNNVVAERGKFQGMTMEPEESLEDFLARLRTQILRCGYEPAQVNRELRDRCVLGSRGELQRKLVREAALKGDELNLEDVRRTARAHRDVMDLTTRLSGAPVPAATDGEAVQVDRLPLVTLSVNGRETEMLVDTGSPVSIVADGSIPGLKLRPSKMQLRSFTGQPVPVRGEATVQTEYGGQRKRLNVVVSGQLRHHPLLGRDWLREIRLDWRSLLQVSEASKRYALQLAAYSYAVELRRSEHMHMADSLSRLAMPCSGVEREKIDREGADVSFLCYMEGAAPVLTAEALASATRRDPVLARVLTFRLQKFLLAYRAAPHSGTGRSPAEMMFGRNVRTRLDMLRPDPMDRFRDQQQRQREAAGGRHRELNIGDTVWARCYSGPQKWRLGTVAARTGPVSYEIAVADALWSRHVDQLISAEPVRTGQRAAAAGTDRPAALGEPGAGASGGARTAVPAPPGAAGRISSEGIRSAVPGAIGGAGAGASGGDGGDS